MPSSLRLEGTETFIGVELLQLLEKFKKINSTQTSLPRYSALCNPVDSVFFAACGHAVRTFHPRTFGPLSGADHWKWKKTAELKRNPVPHKRLQTIRGRFSLDEWNLKAF